MTAVTDAVNAVRGLEFEPADLIRLITILSEDLAVMAETIIITGVRVVTAREEIKIDGDTSVYYLVVRLDRRTRAGKGYRS